MIPLIVLLLLAGLIYYIFFSRISLPPETNAIIDRVLKNPLPEIIRGKSGIASAGGIDIWYECIDPDGAPKGTILLLMGSGGDALFWDTKFMRALLADGYQVIRFDYRGAGMSDWMKQWSRQQPYTLRDLADDAVAVLDALHVQRAHLVGLSMGGMVAQEMAIHFSDRVQSLTLMLTSGFIGDPDLPGLSSCFFLMSILKGLPLLRYRIVGGEANLMREPIAKMALMLGTDNLDIQELAEIVLYGLRKRRGINLRGALQHGFAVQISGSRYAALKTLHVPTLVIHGTADGIIPFEHGKKLVEVIPGAQHLWLEGVEHVFPMPDMPAWLNRILEHVGNAG